MTISKKGSHELDSGRMQQVDRIAARGIPGSSTAADGRQHIRSVPCPSHWSNGAPDHTPYYLSADRRMWCPDVRLDLKTVAAILDAAFPYAWGRNPSSGV